MLFFLFVVVFTVLALLPDVIVVFADTTEDGKERESADIGGVEDEEAEIKSDTGEEARLLQISAGLLGEMV